MSGLTMRAAFQQMTGQAFDGQRDYYQTFGYPRGLTPMDFAEAYLRGDIAGRIIDAFPAATWREPPEVTSSSRRFVEAWEAINDQHDILANLHRLDRLMGLGHYGVLLLGVDGGEQLREPLRQGTNRHLLYVQPHSERTAEITRWNDNPASPRYGKPEMYRLTNGLDRSGAGARQVTVDVHYSRVIHVVEGSLEDDSIGTPRLERIWNRLADLHKLLGGSAEMYWQNVAQIIAFIADPDAEWDPEETEDMKNQLDEMQHGLRRMLRLRGVQPEGLAQGLQGADPKGHVDVQLDMIAGAIGIPKRILIGSERGELSSEQDENNWAARIVERREQFANPVVLFPLIDRLQEIGVLPNVGDDYDCVWPDSDTLGEAAMADIAQKRATAMQAYLSVPGASLIVGEGEFRGWLGLDPDELPAMQEEDMLVEDAPAEAVFNILKTNAAPKPLYVRRQVMNPVDIIDWAKGQGLDTVLLPDDLHVTVAFSRQPVDWMTIDPAWSYHDDATGELVVPAGGPRVVEELGDKGAIVLFFNSNELQWRHKAIRECGASWDWPSYQPHITLTYEQLMLDLGDIEPYHGPIILGPEIFEELDEDWSAGIEEA